VTAPQWRPLSSFRHWLRLLVSRSCIDRLRKKHPEPVAELPDVPSTNIGAFEKLASEEELRVLAELAALLPERQRLALLLVYTEELPQREAATVMDLTPKAFESLLVRARNQLRSLWAGRSAS
jgi:RNA polymerase sigma-70 factor (ECF subfamily)